MMIANILCILVCQVLPFYNAEEILLVENTKERVPFVAELDTTNLRNQLKEDFMKEINVVKQQLASMSKDVQMFKESSQKEAGGLADLQNIVALTACQAAQQTYPTQAVVKYTSLVTHIGMNQDDVEKYTSSGKFICKSPGLYLVSASVVSKTPYANFYLKKNNEILVWPFLASEGGNTQSGTVVVAVGLQIDDTIWIESSRDRNVYIDDNGSCLTVVKIQ